MPDHKAEKAPDKKEPTAVEIERSEQENVEARLGIKLVGDVITPVGDEDE